MSKTLGILITTCDADQKHFDRILNEFTRLGYQFAVNFDHCCPETKSRFIQHPLCLGWYENDNPQNPFDETHRKYALNLLVQRGFDWATYLDTDEVYDRNAHTIIPQILESNADLAWCPCLDFWGDDRHIRVDGMFGPSVQLGDGKQLRKKFYNLKSVKWEYRHADVHAPEPVGLGRELKIERSDLCILHYGIMDYADARFHAERWDTVYMRAKGENPYAGGFYKYIQDQSNKPELVDFNYDTWVFNVEYWKVRWEAEQCR